VPPFTTYQVAHACSRGHHASFPAGANRQCEERMTAAESVPTSITRATCVPERAV
jgi:hypothetical protein